MPGRKDMSKVMREIVFKKYWQLMCIPGVHHELLHDLPMENTDSDTYRGILEFISRCNDQW